jgi:dihydroorotate dehydrogenase
MTMGLASLAFPLLRRLDPERAHGLTIWGLRHGFGPKQTGPDDPALAVRLWGLDFPNPIGVCAGFDKNAEAFAALHRAGFGFVEVGTVTPRPQQGNPRPRIFRLREDAALINRLGFNNEGLDRVAARLAGPRTGILGANIGKNKDTDDPEVDFVTAARRVAALSDYVVVNVSSPNTPGLRALQDRAVLARLIGSVQQALRESTDAPPPLLVKIAPDLTAEDERDIAAVALESGLDGLIVSNTTVDRPESLRSAQRGETGGLSGRPLFDPSTRLLARMFAATEGRVPLIGVGGIASGADAYAKIRAGASLVQLYTALAYHGPGLLDRIKIELLACLRADGLPLVGDAVGAEHRG